jgi:hypothetical protein
MTDCIINKVTDQIHSQEDIQRGCVWLSGGAVALGIFCRPMTNDQWKAPAQSQPNFSELTSPPPSLPPPDSLRPGLHGSALRRRPCHHPTLPERQYNAAVPPLLRPGRALLSPTSLLATNRRRNIAELVHLPAPVGALSVNPAAGPSERPGGQQGQWKARPE